MGGAKKFTDLIVWQKAYDLSVKIQKLTGSFPAEERYRLGDQMRAAASSIPMNIAEGFARWSPKDQANFYTIAKASADELKVELMQSVDFGYCADPIEEAALADEIGAMLYRLRQKVLARISNP
jgi:four helix bundle protein